MGKISVFFLSVCVALTLGMAGLASGAGPVSGKIVETMDSGGYTYLLLENEGKSTWAAVPVAKVAVGDEVTLQPGMMMQNFTSKTLDRTFENIYFCGGLAR